MGDGRGFSYEHRLGPNRQTEACGNGEGPKQGPPPPALRKRFALVDASREIQIRLQNALGLLEAMDKHIIEAMMESQNALGHQVRQAEPDISYDPVEVILRQQIVEHLLCGLTAAGSHHKQYHLEEALKLVALPGEFGEMKADHGWEDGIPE